MFDIIGKRRWFFALSLAVTIPGLIFIVMGFVNPKFGLQFAIDFTGGTVWTIRFEDPNVNPQQVKDVLGRAGDRGQRHPDRHGLHGDPDQGGRARRAAADARADPLARTVGLARAPRRPPAPVRRPRSASPSAASRRRRPRPPRRPRRARRRRARRPPRPAASPSASPGAIIGAGGALPTQGKLGEIRFALEAALGKIAEQQSLSSVGAVVSSDLIAQALLLILFGSIGILIWITIRFQRLPDGRDRPRRPAPRRARGRRRVRDPRHVRRPADRQPVRDRDADRHRVLGPRHDRRVRPRPREQGAARRRAVRRGSSTTRSSRRSAGRSRPA